MSSLSEFNTPCRGNSLLCSWLWFCFSHNMCRRKARVLICKTIKVSSTCKNLLLSKLKSICEKFGFSRLFPLLSIHLKDMAIFIHSITAFPCEFGQGCSFKQGFSFHLFLDRSYKLTFFSVTASVDCFWVFNQSIDNFYEFNNVVMLLN